MDNQHCRFCGQKLKHTFVDLGLSPLANEYLREEDLDKGESFFPLKVQVCDNCLLAQTALYQKPDKIFTEYQYFSSYSESWVQHCKEYVDKRHIARHFNGLILAFRHQIAEIVFQ